MNDFAKGMNSVGQLFPAPISYADYPVPDSAWKCVADSFRQAGDDLRYAFEKGSDAQQEKSKSHR